MDSRERWDLRIKVRCLRRDQMEKGYKWIKGLNVKPETTRRKHPQYPT